jgi:cytochrome c5
MKTTRFLTVLVLAPLGLWSVAATAAPVAGDKVYTATCASCHGTGVLGAPKFGDKAAWAPRIKQGKNVLYTHALDGIRMMPARGGNPALKDAEVKAAIDYMVGKSS